MKKGVLVAGNLLPEAYLIPALAREGFSLSVWTPHLGLPRQAKIVADAFYQTRIEKFVEWVMDPEPSWAQARDHLENCDFLVISMPFFWKKNRNSTSSALRYSAFIERLINLALGVSSIQKIAGLVANPLSFLQWESGDAPSRPSHIRGNSENRLLKIQLRAELELWRAEAEGCPVSWITYGLPIGYQPEGYGLLQFFLHQIQDQQKAPSGGYFFSDVRDVCQSVRDVIQENSQTEKALIRLEKYLNFQEFQDRLAEHSGRLGKKINLQKPQIRKPNILLSFQSVFFQDSERQDRKFWTEYLSTISLPEPLILEQEKPHSPPFEETFDFFLKKMQNI
ncbi:MAG: hypothetical protein N2050_11335 [Flavobacteriales bacterium]|nr:hypothetical protein [Flavobacteriales bacterium]